jgi:hypothetical protein
VVTYRVAVSREDPWWVAVAYGEGLPEHGAATESRTLAGLEEKIRDLIVLRTDADLSMPYDEAVRSFDLEWSWDIGTHAAAALDAYRAARIAADAAQAQYAAMAQAAAAALAADLHASVRDAAELMGLSYQRVAQLLAELQRTSA